MTINAIIMMTIVLVFFIGSFIAMVIKIAKTPNHEDVN